MPKATTTYNKAPEYEYELTEYEDDGSEEGRYDDMRPSDYDGDAGDQNIAYMVDLYKKRLENQLSSKRQKGCAPSREHPSHSGVRTSRPALQYREPLDDLNRDPTFVPSPTARPPRGRGSGGRPRGRGRGRGTGRGRGRGKTAVNPASSSLLVNPASSSLLAHSVSQNTTSQSTGGDSRGKHWLKPELKALLWGANYLKPVLKGRFKTTADGRTMKKLGWEELSEYVTTMGRYDRSVEQCKDKLLYFGQDTKRKRQRIDATYTTGSAQRDSDDELDEYEEAICDWIGEDVSLGIPGMQPPNLKGGGRNDQPWSCYDPHREDRVDYAAVHMPSAAMTAAVEGKLLQLNEQNGVVVADEQEYNDVTTEEVEQEYEANYDRDQRARVEYLASHERTLPPHPDSNDRAESVSRLHVLKRCEGAHTKKKAALDGKLSLRNFDPDPILSDPKVIYKKDLISKAQDIVRRQREKDLNTSNRSSRGGASSSSVSQSSRPPRTPDSRPSSKERRLAISKAQSNPYLEKVDVVIIDPVKPARKPAKSPSFSKIIEEHDVLVSTPPESPSPPSMFSQEKKLYTRQEVEDMIINSHKNTEALAYSEKPIFTTSTPKRVASPREEDVSAHKHNTPQYSNTERTSAVKDVRSRVHDTSALEQIQRISSSSKKRKLFTDKPMEVSASSLPDLNQGSDTEAQVERPDHSLMEEHAKLSADIIKNQILLSANTRKVADSVLSSSKDVTTGISNALRDHAHSIASSMREHGDILIKAQIKNMEEVMDAQGDYRKEQAQSAEDNNKILANIHSKLCERILLKETKMIQGLDRVGEAVCSTAQKFAGSTAKMITGIINMEDVVTRMANSMSRLIETTETLHESNLCSLRTAEKVDNAMSSMLCTLQSLVEAKKYELEQSSTERPCRIVVHVTSVATQSGEGEVQPSCSTQKPVHTIRSFTNSVRREDSAPVITTVLTHPETPKRGQEPVYRVEDLETDEYNGEQRAATMRIPGSSIMQEVTLSQERDDLPEFRVVNRNDFIIVQDGTGEIVHQNIISEPENSDAALAVLKDLQSQALQSTDFVSEADTEESVSDRDGTAYPKRSKRQRKIRIPKDL